MIWYEARLESKIRSFSFCGWAYWFLSWRSCSAEFRLSRSVVLVCMLHIASDLTIITVSHLPSVRKARCDSFYIMKRPKLLWSWALDRGWGPGAREMLSASPTAFWAVCVFACMRALLCVCVCVCDDAHSDISVSVHVCASASHCWGPYLSWHGNYVCIFIFPALLVRHQTCPDSSCPPGRLGTNPPPPNLPSVLCRLAMPHMLAS